MGFVAESRLLKTTRRKTGVVVSPSYGPRWQRIPTSAVAGLGVKREPWWYRIDWSTRPSYKRQIMIARTLSGTLISLGGYCRYVCDPWMACLLPCTPLDMRTESWRLTVGTTLFGDLKPVRRV